MSLAYFTVFDFPIWYLCRFLFCNLYKGIPSQDNLALSNITPSDFTQGNSTLLHSIWDNFTLDDFTLGNFTLDKFTLGNFTFTGYLYLGFHLDTIPNGKLWVCKVFNLMFSKFFCRWHHQYSYVVLCEEDLPWNKP